MFRKVLIANRGEIACRVARTCQRLGIATVAVYSDVDADALHVHLADEAVAIGPAEPAASYLSVKAILAACERTGADAVHPGYGFLSENASLPEALAAAGITFIGPSADVIRLMGDKAAAKRRLAAAGVPVVPGLDAEGLDDAAIAAACDEIGYPLLVKAVAGGGGKGMRAVHEATALPDALAAARREAERAFGDDRLLIERLVAQPRHVEIQIFGDAHGGAVHLFERECSIQRRHQKVVEETPSPAVDADLRARMGAAAVRAATEVSYVGAGTIEFLLAPSGEFYFLEMNTRLQVEHPVTELVTGEDLVEWQLRVAAGEPLPRSQEQLAASGHAIEVRLYAEDPAAGFLPQTGPVLLFDPPVREDVRIDTGVHAGSDVSAYYDPMLAKLIAHGVDRSSAIERLLWLLRHTPVLGVRTNVEYLAAVIDHAAFRAGATTTAFLDEHLAAWSPAPPDGDALAAAAVALLTGLEPASASPWAQLGPWRTGQVGGWRVTLADDVAIHVLAVTGRRDQYRVTSGEDVREVAVVGRGPDRLDVAVDGREATVRLARDGDLLWLHTGGRSLRLRVVPPTRHAESAALVGDAAFQSPMPGAVIALHARAGDAVQAGDTLLVVEAMKMEHPISAPTDGVVEAIHVTVGQSVDAGEVLLAFTPAAAEETSDDSEPGA